MNSIYLAIQSVSVYNLLRNAVYRTNYTKKANANSMQIELVYIGFSYILYFSEILGYFVANLERGWFGRSLTCIDVI